MKVFCKAPYNIQWAAELMKSTVVHESFCTRISYPKYLSYAYLWTKQCRQTQSVSERLVRVRKAVTSDWSVIN